MAKVIACCNAKGGTGKTTVALNLGACLSAYHGKRVLGIDLDAQGNLGIGLGIDPREIAKTTYRLLTDDSIHISECILPIRPNYGIIPNAISAELETRLDSSHNRESLLRMKLKPVRDQYDYIILDTPPAMRTPTLNAMVAADEIIIVVDCGYFALYGLMELMLQVAKAQQAYEKDGQVIRGLLNLYNKGQKLDNDIKRDVTEFFGPLMINTIIHKNVRLGEAASAHKPIIEYDRAAIGSFDFLKLTKELLNEYEPKENPRTTTFAEGNY